MERGRGVRVAADRRAACRPHLDRAARRIGALTVVAWAVVVTSSACGHDWDPLDPRLGASTTSTTGAGAAGTGGSGATGHGGGATGGAGEGGSTGGGSPGGGGPGGGGPGGGGAGPTRCNPMSLLADDFEDGNLDPQWVAYLNGGDVTEGGGVATVVSPSAPVDDAYTVLHGFRYYDLRDSAVSVRVDTLPASSGAGVWLSVDYDGQNWIEIYAQDGGIEFNRLVADNYDNLASLAYDPVDHAYWRMREQGGTLYWETSADGNAYTTQASMPTAAAFPLDLVTSEVGVFKTGGDPGSSFAVFDDYNGGTSTGVYCPTAQLVDDFDDGSWGRIWDMGGESGADVSEIGGALVITPPEAPSDGYGSYYASASFDLSGGSVLVHVLDTVDAGTSAEMGMGVNDRADSSAELLLAGGTLMFRRWLQGSYEAPLWTVAFDAGEHAWWRIRESGSQIVWETSPDGTAWNIGGQTAASYLDVERVQPYLFAGTWEPQSGPGAAVFDDFDLPP